MNQIIINIVLVVLIAALLGQNYILAENELVAEKASEYEQVQIRVHRNNLFVIKD